jgi:hypothetical protein
MKANLLHAKILLLKCAVVADTEMKAKIFKAVDRINILIGEVEHV